MTLMTAMTMNYRGSLKGWGTLRRWAMGGSIRSTSATKSDADVRLEAVYLYSSPNTSPLLS
jgi:hypothetical protein